MFENVRSALLVLFKKLDGCVHYISSILGSKKAYVPKPKLKNLVHRSIVKGYYVNGDKNFRLALSYPLEQQLVINKDKIDDFAKWLLGDHEK
ncbi:MULTISPECIES: hypothetical protein [Sphingobacterium]|uniref:hypothetical protein n=1 Tax=Sphingobacterium TaxID=28453 RepID=UPI00257977E3|nr:MULTISPECIES: hypothetical protein [Sphingobacterium]